jgi:arginine decarboxylase
MTTTKERTIGDRAMTDDPLEGPWTPDDSVALYGCDAWGDGYVAIRSDGHLAMRPKSGDAAEIDLYDVVEGLRARGLSAPLLMRFSDVLHDRLARLHGAFAEAIADNKYGGGYLTVFPIKVNQQRSVVEEVHRHGAAFGAGLEVGSKPELLAVMAMTGGDDEGRPIICNGFKDSNYLEAVVLATKLGRNIIPVIEKPDEIRILIRHADNYGVKPTVGVRVKLASRGAGRWRASAGARSKFGLFASEVLEMVELLREHDMLDSLQLVHAHAGSQLQDIRRVKEVISELAHFYGELVALGAPIRYIDIGGGLGIDYDGSRTNSSSSMNYTLQEYASEVVYRIGSVCDEREVPHPSIISESGRALAAHHSVLVFEVLGAASRDRSVVAPQELELDDDAPQPVRDLAGAYAAVNERSLIECFHDAVEARRQVVELFALGFLSLRYRGLAERLFWGTCERVRDAMNRFEEVPEELEALDEILADTYFCNLSIFQSLPDVWAIGQRFPIVPLQRLDEKPTRNGVLADMTCDSDGKIDRFTAHGEVVRTLPLHELKAGERYYLAVFLVGAYQEALGDLHNLFGDAHAADISIDETGEWRIEEVIKGDTAAEVLGYMQYDPARMHAQLARDCEAAIRKKRLSVEESSALLRFYESEMAGYTYLTDS